MAKEPDSKLLELEKKQKERIEDLKKYPRKQQHVHEQKFKLGQKKMEEAARDDYTSSPPSPAVTFERPQEGKIEKRIGGSEEDAMIRTLRFVSKDGSGQREDVKRPMYASKPIIREWIESIMKIS